MYVLHYAGALESCCVIVCLIGLHYEVRAVGYLARMLARRENIRPCRKHMRRVAGVQLHTCYCPGRA